jgi:DNA-binding NarL/FixJ family response regulator
MLLVFLSSNKVQNENCWIADDINKSLGTVKNHISGIFEKLGVKNRLELVNFINNLL